MQSPKLLRDLKKYHFNQAIAFKSYQTKQRGQQSGEKLSKETMYATLAHLKRFFQRLAEKPG